MKNNSVISLLEDGIGHKLFEGILKEPWIRLACSAYLSKHSSIFDGQTPQRFRDTFSNPPLSEDCQRLLGWVGLGDKDCLQTNEEWCHFVRAVCFHKETAKKDFEAHIMPSLAALDRHRSRAECVLHIAYSSPFSVCTQLPCFQAYGWTVGTQGTVTIDWDDIQAASFFQRHG